MDIHLQLKLAKEKIEELEREVVFLKEENEDLKRQFANIPRPRPNTNQPSVTKSSTKDEKINLFMSLFRGRSDVFARKWINKKGNPVFSPVKDRKTNSYLPLTKTVMEEHLKGEQIIGLYPLLNDNTCYFLAVDFDKKEWKEDVEAFITTCKRFSLTKAISISLALRVLPFTSEPKTYITYGENSSCN